jgi:ABC-type transport system involved in multi-copper enzyme maturation permease subunit
MPIHDQSYRRYKGSRANLRGAWTVIATTGILSLLKKRVFLGVLIGAWIPFIVRAVQIYVTANYPQATMFAMTAESFRQFFQQQAIFVFFVTVYVGAGLIANDRRANALQIYLSKPMTRAEYVLGKLAILAVFVLLVTLVPGLLLLLLQALFSGSFQFVRDHIYLVPAMTLYSVLQAAVVCFTMLALSSLSNSSRFVGILYAGVVLFSDAIFNTLRGITGSTAMSWLSFPATMAQLGDLIFRVPLRYSTPPAVSFVVALALVAVSLSVLERKVRGVEVIT